MRLISLRMLVDECRPFIKTCLFRMYYKRSYFFSILLARALLIILRSAFIKDMGR